VKIEWRIDLTPILVALILAVAVTTAARNFRTPQYAPVGTGKMGADGGFYLDTKNGRVSFGP
jgi:hypothetical protein